jgi:hypothetical protein
MALPLVRRVNLEICGSNKSFACQTRKHSRKNIIISACNLRLWRVGEEPRLLLMHGMQQLSNRLE